jgi:hypothetical protein
MGGRALSTLALGGVPLSPQPLTHPAAETLAPWWPGSSLVRSSGKRNPRRLGRPAAMQRATDGHGRHELKMTAPSGHFPKRIAATG